MFVIIISLFECLEAWKKDVKANGYREDWYKLYRHFCLLWKLPAVDNIVMQTYEPTWVCTCEDIFYWHL